MNNLYLVHFGTKGQKWGVRHWQNPDGTFNEAGKKRYFGTGAERKALKKEKKELYKRYGELEDSDIFAIGKFRKGTYTKSQEEKALKELESMEKRMSEIDSREKELNKERAKKIAIGAAVVAGTALAIYGGYKLSKFIDNQSNDYIRKIGESVEKKYSNSSLWNKDVVNTHIESGNRGIKNKVQNAVKNISGNEKSINRDINKYDKMHEIANWNRSKDQELLNDKYERYGAAGSIVRGDSSNPFMNYKVTTNSSRTSSRSSNNSNNAYSNVRRAQDAMANYQNRVNNAGKDLDRINNRFRR